MPLVVDAGVAVQVVILEPHSRNAKELFADALIPGDAIVAPALLRFECTNVIRKRIHRDREPLSTGAQILDDLLAQPITYVNPPDLHHRALSLAERYNLGGLDAHYVALAQILGCDLWVDDGRLLRAAASLPFVRAIGSYVTH